MTSSLVEVLRALLDGEYLADLVEWGPGQPYGYAPHDVYLVARAGTDIAGVLVSEDARGIGMANG